MADRLNSKAVYSLIFPLLLISACNWVDSTGRQGNKTPSLELQDGDIIARLEEESLSVNAAATDADGIVESYVWSEATEEGPLQVCVNHIDLDLAANSLSEVCEDSDNCEILFIEDESETGVFSVMLPKITAPVGLTHQLVVTDNDGGKTELNIHFCVDSVNEAPVVADDQYSVVEGTTLVVEDNSADSLLSNDSDDKDIRNRELTVLGLVSGKEPQHAEDFSLGANGGFTYSISPLTSFSVKQDSFSYEVSDGGNISQGTVVLDLSVQDDPPRPIGFIPDQSATIGIAFGPLNVSDKFFDPERAELSFSAVGLPTGIAISNSGIISGTADQTNSLGSYSVTVSASDGPNTVSQQPFTLTLKENGPPIIDSQLDDQLATEGVAFSVDTAGSFSDPEGSALTFSGSGLPNSLDINTNGRISGTPLNNEIGTYTVAVTASDGINETVMTFALRVQPNQPPVFNGPIPRQTAPVNQLFSVDVSQYFSDPEGDPMTFTANGLPASGSLQISSDGVISGTPTVDDRSGILGDTVEVTATDNHGNSATGSFTLSIF